MEKQTRTAITNAIRTLSKALDGEGTLLSSVPGRTQLDKVFYVLSDYYPHTLGEIAYRAGCSTASASARIRELRNSVGRAIESRRLEGGGSHEYTLAD